MEERELTCPLYSSISDARDVYHVVSSSLVTVALVLNIMSTHIHIYLSLSLSHTHCDQETHSHIILPPLWIVLIEEVP